MQWFKIIKCKKIKCAIKFMRVLITNFHISSLIQKVDKNMNILAIANANMQVWWTLWNNLVLGVGCMSGTHTWLWRLAKDWERPTKRAIMAIIMQRDKTLLIKA